MKPLNEATSGKSEVVRLTEVGRVEYKLRPLAKREVSNKAAVSAEFESIISKTHQNRQRSKQMGVEKTRIKAVADAAKEQ